MPLTQHPLSAAFPAMDDADYQALKDDIEYHGQREPIIVFDGMVLDGWHRYRACLDLGIEPTQFGFGGDDPVAFVKSQNLHRRHLTGSQRAAAVVACLEWRAPGRPNNREATSLFPKREEIAQAAGVTVRTVSQVQTAKKAGLLEPIRDGALTAEEAAKIARGAVSKPKPKPEPAPEEYASDEPDAVAILSEENDRLNDRLALVAMDATPEERTAATDTIADLRARIKVLEAELSAVKSSRDSYMAENGEMKKQLAGYKRQLQKLQATPPALNGGSFGEHHAATRRPN